MREEGTASNLRRAFQSVKQWEAHHGGRDSTPRLPRKDVGEYLGGVGSAPMIRRILHATDFSPASRAAFKKAVELAEQNRAELVLLHGSVAGRVVSAAPCPVLTVRGK